MNIETTIRGMYMNNEITGKIIASRAINTSNSAMEFKVELDSPITVFGTKRTSVLMITNFDGSANEYSKTGEWMVAA